MCLPKHNNKCTYRDALCSNADIAIILQNSLQSILQESQFFLTLFQLNCKTLLFLLISISIFLQTYISNFFFGLITIKAVISATLFLNKTEAFLNKTEAFQDVRIILPLSFSTNTYVPSTIARLCVLFTYNLDSNLFMSYISFQTKNKLSTNFDLKHALFPIIRVCQCQCCIFAPV